MIRENGTIIDNGLEEIFVDTEIFDGTDIAEPVRKSGEDAEAAAETAQ